MTSPNDNSTGAQQPVLGTSSGSAPAQGASSGPNSEGDPHSEGYPNPEAGNNNKPDEEDGSDTSMLTDSDDYPSETAESPGSDRRSAGEIERNQAIHDEIDRLEGERDELETEYQASLA
jgi:hypothetical protein